MSVHPTDYLVHFSNILLLVSYSVRNILWLRWFAVAAALTNMPYFLYQAEHPLAADPVGRRVHGHQPLSDLAHLYGAPSGGAVSGRADALRYGLPLAHAPRLRRSRDGGRLE